jgi:translation initiation factor IF-1
MPGPNVRGGKGYKKRKTNRVRNQPNRAEENINVEEGQGYYATIVKRLGGAPACFEATLSNGTMSIIQARGRMHKKQWMNAGDKVLVNNDGEIVRKVRDTDNDAIDAKKIMEKAENNKSVFCTFVDDDSSDEDMDLEKDSYNNPNDFLKKLYGMSNNKKETRNKKEEESQEESQEEYDEEYEECEEYDEECDEENDEENNEENEENENNYYDRKEHNKKDKRNKNKKGFDRSRNNHGDLNIDDI